VAAVKHGAKDDPRYPSPRQLRSVLSFVIDLVAHLGLAFLIAFVIRYQLDAVLGSAANLFLVAAALVLFVLISFVDRVLVQCIFGATLGKAVIGLRVIRDDTGGPGTLWLFLRDWLLSVLTIVGAAMSPCPAGHTRRPPRSPSRGTVLRTSGHNRSSAIAM
jgi:uncharacterized RDD family membrane protein YckC